jgi:hypothetical protein
MVAMRIASVASAAFAVAAGFGFDRSTGRGGFTPGAQGGAPSWAGHGGPPSGSWGPPAAADPAAAVAPSHSWGPPSGAPAQHGWGGWTGGTGNPEQWANRLPQNATNGK